MPAETTIESPPRMTESSHRMTFFRQSGWMMIATVGSGMFMSAVHVCSKKLSGEEYAVFGALIQLINLMTIPALGLQMVFAQQASAAISDERRHQLVGTVRAVMWGTFCIWLAMAAFAFLDRSQLLSWFKLSSYTSLWLTVAVALTMLWLPIFQGLLQGRQNFLWLGWVAIFNGVGRVFFGVAIVFLLHGNAAGLMLAVLLGLVAAVGTAIWQNRDLLAQTGAPFDWRGWLRLVIPFTIGAGAFQFIFSADMLVVQNYLGGDVLHPEKAKAAAAYVVGGTLARAIVASTAPLAAVMFPKLVESAARSHKHTFNLMGLTLLGTAVLAAMAAIGLTLVAPLLIKYGSKPEYISIMPLMPLFSWVMVPLAVGNVLLSNLLAHSRFKVVPAVALVAVGYWIALQYYHDSFKTVIETLGVFSLLYLAVCAAFTCIPRSQANEPAPGSGPDQQTTNRPPAG
jgi:O-antigen/teichoic acid export membrane protein